MSKKFTIENVNYTAAEKCGECLSDTYINAHEDLKWRCAKKTQVVSNIPAVKSGSWSPYCAGRARLTIEQMKKNGSLSQVYALMGLLQGNNKRGIET